jgi:hypothetical protein
LVAITAQYERCALLAEERKLRAMRQGIEVLTCREVFAEIGFELLSKSAPAVRPTGLPQPGRSR